MKSEARGPIVHIHPCARDSDCEVRPCAKSCGCKCIKTMCACPQNIYTHTPTN